MSKNNKVGWKNWIKFGQSVSSGMINFEGCMCFDDATDYQVNRDLLVSMIKDQELIFELLGYKVASLIPNNMKDLASKSAQAKLGYVVDPEKKKALMEQYDKDRAIIDDLVTKNKDKAAATK